MCRSARSAFTGGIVGQPSKNELVFVGGLKACKLEQPNDDAPPRQRVKVKSECVLVAHKHPPQPRPTSAPQPGPAVKAESEVKPSEASSASSRSGNPMPRLVPKQPVEPPPHFLCRVPPRQMKAEPEPEPKSFRRQRELQQEAEHETAMKRQRAENVLASVKAENDEFPEEAAFLWQRAQRDASVEQICASDSDSGPDPEQSAAEDLARIRPTWAPTPPPPAAATTPWVATRMQEAASARLQCAPATECGDIVLVWSDTVSMMDIELRSNVIHRIRERSSILAYHVHKEMLWAKVVCKSRGV